MDPSLPFIVFDSIRLQVRSLSPINTADDGVQWNSDHDPIAFQQRCVMVVDHVKRVTMCYSNAKRFVSFLCHFHNIGNADIHIVA
jgi:hypothetical protein